MGTVFRSTLNSHLFRKLNRPLPFSGRGAISIGTWFLWVNLIWNVMNVRFNHSSRCNEGVFPPATQIRIEYKPCMVPASTAPHRFAWGMFFSSWWWLHCIALNAGRTPVSRYAPVPCAGNSPVRSPRCDDLQCLEAERDGLVRIGALPIEWDKL